MMNDSEVFQTDAPLVIREMWIDTPPVGGPGVWLKSNEGNLVRVPSALVAKVKDFFIKATKAVAEARQRL